MIRSELNASSFQSLRLDADVVRGLRRAGCHNPTPVQQESIVPLLYHRDIIVEADAGSGATTGFAAAVLHMCDYRSNFVQAVISTASYRHAAQVYNVFKQLSHYLNLNIHLCGSSSSIEEELKGLSTVCTHIVIGAASRIQSMARNSHIRISKATICIVDKTNEVFVRDLQDSVMGISRYISSRAQYAFFSETMPKQIDAFVAQLGLNCTRIVAFKSQPGIHKMSSSRKTTSLAGIRHFYLLDDGYQILDQLEQLFPISPVIIFGGSRGRVESIACSLRERIRQVASLHPASSEVEKGIVLQQFRAGIIRIIVVSDEILSEPHLVQAPFIINVGLPALIDVYAQRVCRPDRNQRQSVVVNIVRTDELGLLGTIEERFGIMIEELPMTEEEVDAEDDHNVHLPDLSHPVAPESVQRITLDPDEHEDGLFTM